MSVNQRGPSRRRVIPSLVEEFLETRILPSQVTYHGGILINTPEVQALYYGSGWNTPATEVLRGQIDGFLSYIVNSPFMDFLNQYNINRGTFLGSKVYNATLPYSPSLGYYAVDQLGFGRNTDQA